MAATAFDPNPSAGKVPLTDYCRLIAAVFGVLPFTLASYLLRRIFKRRDIPWLDDLKRSMVRFGTTYVPLSILRYAVHDLSRGVLAKPRFSDLKENIFRTVKTDSFVGYWICSTSLERSGPPSESDVVIYFFHGGGYAMGEPSQYLVFLLRLAEGILDRGVSVSIFALDYSLAPEFPFPAALMQAAAGYDYLINSANIPSSKIALMGDSAGGHLVLSLLSHLHTPLLAIPRNPSANLPKPEGGAFIISPWISLANDNATFKQNAHADILTKTVLDRWASYALGPKPSAVEYKTFLTTSASGGTWKEILPKTTWVTAGETELFVGDIEAWVALAKEQGGADVRLHVERGAAHDHEFFGSVEEEKKYLRLPFEKKVDGQLMSGIDAAAAAVVDTVKR